jgi:hypothetical protein
MDDVVALKIRDKKRGRAAFLTWCRVFDRTDRTRLKAAVVSGAAERFGFHHVTSIELCSSLQDVSECTYFFEGLIAIAGQPIPFGRTTYRLGRPKCGAESKVGKNCTS